MDLVRIDVRRDDAVEDGDAASVIVGTFLFMFGGPAVQLVQNPVHVALQGSALWTISLVLLAVIAGVVQFQTTRRQEIDTYNRFAEL